MATETLVKITGGPSTITFYDGLTVPTGAGYRLDAYTPAVADMAEEDAPGRGNYEEVVENLSVTVIGTSVPDCYSKIHALVQALEQSERFGRGERNLGAVNLQYSPKGATVSSDTNPLNRLLLGRAPDGGAMWELPSDFELLAGTNLVARGIRIRVRAQGEWLYTKPTTGSGTTERVTSGPATENTVVKDLTFTGTAPLGRYPLAYHVLFSGAGSGMNGLILLARKNGANNNIVVGAAGGLGPGAPFSDFNDASNDPKQGTNVLRFTPAGTTAQVTPTITNCSQFQRATVIINFRNNNATTYKVRARFNPATSSAQIVYSPYETIDAVNTQCRFLVMAPTGLLPGVAYGITLELTASTASGTLDINYVAVINEGDPYTQAIVLENGGRNVVIRSPLISDDLDVLALSAPSNALTDTLETAPNTAWVPTLSAVRALFGFGNTMQVLVCMNEGGALWHPNNGGAVAQIEHRLFRRLTYLTPQ